ncbi:helix-turn-helix domain-containing protein [Butyricimonas synergistica]|uniref:helix-turn-helix domain-containing protein n=1 Tax=Butyricimonas synergistica TaxID=544644 RepID=UPI0022E3C798|nr:helix-turn-helix domain-containing protein [Butyricimonas synergistica]
MDISDRLKLLRKTLNLTQAQLASVIGISRSGYASIEMRLTGLTPRNQNAICETFSVNPVWLETGIGEMFLEPTKGNDILTEALSKDMGVSKDWIESGAGKMFNKEIYQKADVTDRFIIALEHLKLQGIPYSEIATKIGASVSLVSEIRRGKTKLAPHFAKKFIEAFEINAKWLLFGEGDSIFKNITSTEDVTNVHPVIINDEWIDVPFVPLHARATFAESFLDTNVKEIEIVRIQKRPGINYNKARVFEVDGDSMEPTLVSGEQVLCEVIDPSNWRFTTGVVVVAFGNMVVIKRIKDNDLTNGKLVLWSDNEQGGKITLSKDTDEIRRMYKVKYTVYKPIR